ncbi:MAG: hypothetical protein NTX42_06080 [Methanothrix sp.]|nr:hypothetical protein [Methanothrix sp.]
MDSQAISEQMQSLLERIRRLEDADNGGWISAVEEKWTYASADDPTFTLAIPGDFSWKYCRGQRVRLQQAGGAIKYYHNNRRELFLAQHDSDPLRRH